MGIPLYITSHTRPDIAVYTSILAQHVESPSQKYQVGAVKIVMYPEFTKRYALVLKQKASTNLIAYVDSRWPVSLEQEGGHRAEL